jgi:hypothetical protein
LSDAVIFRVLQALIMAWWRKMDPDADWKLMAAFGSAERIFILVGSTVLAGVAAYLLGRQIGFFE